MQLLITYYLFATEFLSLTIYKEIFSDILEIRINNNLCFVSALSLSQVTQITQFLSFIDLASDKEAETEVKQTNIYHPDDVSVESCEPSASA